MLPSFYMAHGAPSLAIEEHAYTDFLKILASQLPKPEAIVVFSAHWESAIQQIGAAVRPETIYDFSGFSKELYEITYPAKGSLPLSLHIKSLFEAEGIACEINDQRGLDHGVWALLHILYPDADIPVVPLSVNPNLAMEEHYRIGSAVAKLKEHNVLIVGSGGTVHNLRKLDRSAIKPQRWAVQFDEWLAEQLETWNLEALFDYMNRAPFAKEAVPTREHLVPLLLAMGAAEPNDRAKLLHRSYQMGTLSLSCWMFGAEEEKG
ncbi:dioxygenase family protein [Paenibacillus hexagrammi]|uniref:Dioxygenase n=1 Tax=Paenibacillus hexagrammi TaxID=2908839 RepID=A0ABY3SGS2_9BACL|nr:class III extradiol ring-cleavage dioxygenase [Paenibacillus sp. YPD9-1]UJF32683.1 dioxygenase [Paenibacillus sp. YPD9-1]